MSTPVLHRRTLLKSAGALAAGSILGGASSRIVRSASEQDTDLPVLDVAIVGGGIAGSYCIWRLSGGMTRRARGSALLASRERRGLPSSR